MATAEKRRILVLANETLAGEDVVEAVRDRAAGAEAEILVIAPALSSSRLSHWLSSDVETAREAAESRLRRSVGAFDEAGMDVNGQLGDADPLQALDDAIRVFRPHEIVIGTLPPERSRWLERDVVTKARARHDLPVTHLVVDVEVGLHRADAPAPGRSAPPTVRVYHGASHRDALDIRENGFRDAPVNGASGVLVVDDPSAAAWGDDAVLLGVDLPASALEGRDEAGGAHRYVLPAGLLNGHGPPITVDDWSE